MDGVEPGAVIQGFGDLPEYDRRRLDDALRRLTETGASALEVARAAVWLFGPDGDRLHRVHLFHRSSGEHMDGGELRRDHFPEYFQALEADPLVAAENVHADPRTAGLSDAYAAPLGITAWIDAPIPGAFPGMGVRGIVRFEHLGPLRRWTDGERDLARGLGAAVGAVLDYFSERVETDGLTAPAHAAASPTAGPEASPGGGGERRSSPSPSAGRQNGGGFLAERFPGGMALVTADGTILSCNRALAQMLGHADAEELQGTSLRNRISRTDTWDDLVEQVEGDGRVEGREVRARRPDGSRVWLLVNAVRATEGTDAAEGLVVSVVNITERKKAEDRLQRLANRDPLTGAANRRLFQEAAENALALADRHGREMAVLYMDLRRFKEINDEYGHDVGDRVLTSVADRLRSRGRESDLVARIGGDEFAVLLTEVEGREGARRAAERFVEALRPPVQVEGLTVEVGLTVGVAIYPEHGRDIRSLLRLADQAMYRGKEWQREEVVVWDEEERGAPAPAEEGDGGGEDRLLATALEEGRLDLLWQPVHRTSDGERVGVEGLLRWDHPDRGRIPAGQFVQRAEQLGWIESFDRWALDRAAQHLSRWIQDRGLEWVALNVSPQSLVSPEYRAALRERLADGTIPPGGLLVQTAVNFDVHPASEIAAALAELREAGFRTSLDLWGHADELLNVVLTAVQVDVLEMDPDFLSRLQGLPRGITVLDAHREGGLRLLVKKVENESQYRQARSLQCDFIQGEHLAAPMSATELLN